MKNRNPSSKSNEALYQYFQLNYKGSFPIKLFHKENSEIKPYHHNAKNNLIGPSLSPSVKENGYIFLCPPINNRNEQLNSIGTPQPAKLNETVRAKNSSL